MKGVEKELGNKEKSVIKKPYEMAKIEEHEPLEEATATVYYYYTF
jgi:hypothetical protein